MDYIENELLCYLKCNFGKKTKDELRRIIENFYLDEEIMKAKQVMSNLATKLKFEEDKNMEISIEDGNCQSDFDNVFHLYTAMHAKKTALPLFVAANTARIPCGHDIRQNNSIDKKVFNDPIHGHIEFDPLCIAIIDTPQFQRLRNIKQLGGGYFVFPGASHNRFEHSLGVGYLAGVLARKLKKGLEEDKVPKEDLEITDKDILCLEIAGLCHDLGHGPFSHTFDERFLRLHKKLNGESPDGWKHEDGSVAMFDHMIEVNGLKVKFPRELTDENIALIKNLIYGDIETVQDEELKKKKFLFEIVANKITEVDVDKWDYFARDCHHLGIPNNFDHKRLMHFAKVVEDPEDDCYRIAFRDKQVGEIYDMFHTRNSLHRRALQHKNKVIVEYMLSEALHYANNHLRFPGKKNGRSIDRRLSNTVKDMEAYTHVNDSVYQRILHSRKDYPDMKKARDILKNIEKRKLYPCVGHSKKKNHEKFSASLFHRIIANKDVKKKRKELKIIKKNLTNVKNLICVDDKDLELDEEDTEKKLAEYMMRNEFTRDDFIILFPTYDYGKGGADPIQKVLFYDKEGNVVKFGPGEVTRMIPEVFFEKYVRLYSRKRENVDRMYQCFKRFCREYGFDEPKSGDPLTQVLQ